ncbi:uncharacterized protein YciO-like [Phoenix dactylifera]|uniref:Threonylcarbamoyl-AMP synthase n=1 Tax=Phoenix dactylifera TaxID=42345 RepID=A0A8B9AK04_PHODC|nr:uncharacterized protein YciO-like [Phoenix dactylifera]
MLSDAIAGGCATSAAPTAAGAPSLSFRRSVSSLRLPTPLPSPPPLRQHLPVRALALKRNPKRLKYSAPRFFKDGERMVYVEMDPSGSDGWKLEPIIKLIKEGGVGVIPTDTVYAVVCDLKSHSSIERLRRIKEEDSKPLSILCRSFQDIDTYTMGFPRGNAHGQPNIFRAVKHCLPGPYTFILPASKQLPKQCIKPGMAAKYASRRHVGVRIPDDSICQTILQNLDAPLVSTSVKWPEKDQWMVDPVIIADTYEPEGLDFVVDGGVRVADPSTVVDMTGACPKVIRQGKGPRLDWMVVEGEDSAAQEELPFLQAA